MLLSELYINICCLKWMEQHIYKSMVTLMSLTCLGNNVVNMQHTRNYIDMWFINANMQESYLDIHLLKIEYCHKYYYNPRAYFNIMLYVNIIMLHIDVIKSHVNILIYCMLVHFMLHLGDRSMTKRFVQMELSKLIIRFNGLFSNSEYYLV